MESVNQKSDEFSLTRLRQILARQRRVILASALIASVSALAGSFVIPPTYRADATLLPRKQAESGLSTLMGLSGQSDAAISLGGLVGGNRSADLTEILSSRSMAERVINKLHLERELTGWKSREQLVNKLNKAVKILPPSGKSKVIIIRVELHKASLCASVANAYSEELKTFLDEMGYNDASKNRLFIERQLERSKKDLAEAERRLTAFQAENRLVSLPDTVKVSIEAIGNLEAKRIETTASLRANQGMVSTLMDKVSTLHGDPNSLVELQVKQRALQEQEAAIRKAQQDFRSQLSELPPKGLALARLQRDVQVQNTVYLALTQQYETALISEAKDSDAFYILDKAWIPERPVRPMKALNFSIGLILGLMVGSAIACLREFNGSRFSSVMLQENSTGS